MFENYQVFIIEIFSLIYKLKIIYKFAKFTKLHNLQIYEI